MPRLHFVKKARKDNPVAKAGESYYWWQFAYRGKSYSKERPKRSQLTQSSFYAQMWDIEDDLIGEAVGNASNPEELESVREEIVSGLESLRDECEDAMYNMPEQLQDDSIPARRVEYVDDMISEVESVTIDDDMDEDALESAKEELQGIGYQGE